MRVIQIAIVILCGGVFAEKNFSQTMLADSNGVYEKILKHPFNQELKKGTLDPKKYIFYLVQDSYYLRDFSRALSVLSSKLQDKDDTIKLLRMARGSLLDDELASQFEWGKDFTRIEQSPTSMLYSNYLLKLSLLGTVEELAAGLLPCFSIYLKLAVELKQTQVIPNSYQAWINTYTSDSYHESVKWYSELVDKLAKETSERVRTRMKEAYILSTRMEWLFWESAYQLEAWKI